MMTGQERGEKEMFKVNEKFWCYWMSRYITYTGHEGYEKGYNIMTKDYTPRHYYDFKDAIGCSVRIYDEDVSYLVKK